MSSEKAHRPGTGRIRSLPLDDTQLAVVLDRLDAGILDGLDAGRTGDNRDSGRQEDRYSYRLKGLVITLRQPGGTEQSFLVPTRNISSSGFAFLHGGFLHTGTTCTAQLITLDNTWKTVKGTVVRCRHIAGRIHEVGIRLTESVDLEAFVPNALKRRVLLADDDASIRRLLSFHLRQLNSELVAVENGREAIEEAMKNTFDLILLDLEMPVLDGFSTVRELRQKGYTGWVVAMTALTGQGDRERCLTEGFDSYLEKPVGRDELAHVLSSLNQKPLHSSLASEPGMNELISGFAADLVPKVRAIEEAMSKKDCAELGRLARLLKGEGGGYGFEPITAAAEAVEQAAKDPGELQELDERVKKLVALCTSVRLPCSSGA